jgi:hypothetical protein
MSPATIEAVHEDHFESVGGADVGKERVLADICGWIDRHLPA